MKELKFKMLWVVDVQGIQWASFRYKVNAIFLANRINGIVSKRKVLTDKY